MANVLNIINDDEKKYFDSRGEYEPAGYSASDEESGKDSEAEEDTSEQPGQSEVSAEPDESISSGDGAEEESGLSEDSDGETEYRSENTGKSSKRDFTKAYGIAESKRQELKAQLEEQSRQNQLLQQQLQYLMQQQQQGNRAPAQQAPAVNIPDPHEDPIGYQSYQFEQLNKTVQAQQQYLAQQAKVQQQQQAIAQLDHAYKTSAMEFQKEAPDFMDAYKFLEKSKIQEYVALGYTPQEASSFLQEDERILAAKAFKERANPAARIYAAAVARGFASEATETKLDKVSKGMEKGKSLPRAGGKNIEKGYDISRIDDMSEEEFDKFFNSVRNESKKNGSFRKDFY